MRLMWLLLCGRFWHCAVGCGEVGQLGLGCCGESFIRRQSVVVGMVMIYMYAKCGLIESMHGQNVQSYSNSGPAMHDLFKETVGKMPVKPNWITIIALLTACSHAGNVKEGWYCFPQMEDEYGIIPSNNHYACIVDLLGRAGLMEKHSILRNHCLWNRFGVQGALVGVCRIHGNT